MDEVLKQILHFTLANRTLILPYLKRGDKSAPNDFHLCKDDFKSSCLLSPGSGNTCRFLAQTSSVAQAFVLQLL